MCLFLKIKFLKLCVLLEHNTLNINPLALSIRYISVMLKY